MVKEIAQLLKDHGALLHGDFVLASGARSSYYLDVKTAMTDPALLKELAEEITRAADFEVVAGVAVGGVPIAVATSLAANRPYSIIRSEKKDHGTAGRVIGRVEGRRVLLVEDVTTSGGSALYGVQVLRESGASIDTVVTVVDRRQGAKQLLGTIGVRLIALATADEITG